MFKVLKRQEPYKPENRVKYLQMSIEDKRKLYKCKEKYQTLEEIKNWPELSKELKSKVKSEFVK
jgi:hypothetical protein